ncbi:putative U6 snRNA-associated Sm-like protein LSm4 [Candida viswanathii]|uniref:LSM complex subunit LSM4 n=1 Tax=Candida viswanathii TaxID=5486 RepID=A0A367YHH2_9ASCO|nr:putative U6 snRNA-associated Sm-like protein LSm4 [Candida viswanathii]
MLPLYLLTAAKNKPVLIELKTGETYNGDLTNCDSWMNLTLHNVIQTSSWGRVHEDTRGVHPRNAHQVLAHPGRYHELCQGTELD